MLILLRELRHLQLHVVTTTFTRENSPAVYREGEGRVKTTFRISIVPSSDLHEIKHLKNAKRYDPAELDAAINWLNGTQLNWGIGDVLQRGIQAYADLVINRYHLPAP